MTAFFGDLGAGDLVELDAVDREILLRSLIAFERQMRVDGGRLPPSLRRVVDVLRATETDRDRQRPPLLAGGGVSPHAAPVIAGQLYTIAGSARACGFAKRTLERRVASGELPSVGSGRLRRVRGEDLQAWLAGAGRKGA